MFDFLQEVMYAEQWKEQWKEVTTKENMPSKAAYLGKGGIYQLLTSFLNSALIVKKCKPITTRMLFLWCSYDCFSIHIAFKLCYVETGALYPVVNSISSAGLYVLTNSDKDAVETVLTSSKKLWGWLTFKAFPQINILHKTGN